MIPVPPRREYAAQPMREYAVQPMREYAVQPTSEHTVRMDRHWTDEFGSQQTQAVYVTRAFAARWGYTPSSEATASATTVASSQRATHAATASRVRVVGYLE